MGNRDDIGRRNGDTGAAAPAPPANQAQAPAQNQAINQTNTKYKILGCKNKVYLFPEIVPQKNRRFNIYEQETEKWISTMFKRPPRSFVHDNPFYPYLVPEPLVNFDLNFKQ